MVYDIFSVEAMQPSDVVPLISKTLAEMIVYLG